MPYQIIKQIEIKGIRIYMLHIAENLKNIDGKIIPQEQREAIGRYKFAKDSNKRLLARSFLYEHLNILYGIPDFETGVNKYGKPFLKAAPHIRFNFSYSGDYLLLGISEGLDFGIDIERINPLFEVGKVAPLIMHPAEQFLFDSYADDDSKRQNYFFRLFSAKESIIKAFGTGLFFDVKTLDLTAGRHFVYKNNSFCYTDLGVWENCYAVAVCHEE